MNRSWIRQYAIIIFFVLLIYFVANIVSYSETKQQRYFAQEVLKFAYEAKKITGLPASIATAQCILETGWGKHTPKDWKTGEESNNFFGIKAFGDQPYVRSWTYEWEDGKYVSKLAKFRKYNTFLESLIDYGRFIYKNPRYREAIIVKNNPIKYIQAIWKAGYATSPSYVWKVIAIAEQCNFLTRKKWEEQKELKLTKIIMKGVE